MWSPENGSETNAPLEDAWDELREMDQAGYRSELVGDALGSFDALRLYVDGLYGGGSNGTPVSSERVLHVEQGPAPGDVVPEGYAGNGPAGSDT